MKNLLIYINPAKSFGSIHNDDRMVETQIDNSLDFFEPKDILFVTNFPYKYHGVKSLIVPDDLFCEIKAKASKINAIIYLLENGLLGDLTWFHDLDAFQLSPIELNLDRDAGFTDYGWRDHWNTGSIFFKPNALDIFKLIKHRVYKWRTNEELALRSLTKVNEYDINSRYRKINISYNLGAHCLDYGLDYVDSISEKPVKVAHFPPYNSNIFEMYKPILTRNLIKLINEKYYSQ